MIGVLAETNQHHLPMDSEKNEVVWDEARFLSRMPINPITEK